MKTRICILFIIVLITTACSSVVNMTSEKMNKLELGMSKQQVTEILGSNYTIAEKKIENGVQVEVLSYRDFYKDDEFYMFTFKNNTLEKWHRELALKQEVVKDKYLQPPYFSELISIIQSPLSNYFKHQI